MSLKLGANRFGFAATSSSLKGANEAEGSLAEPVCIVFALATPISNCS
jgi:hypothetical protein